jgi:hypothetical protein
MASQRDTYHQYFFISEVVSDFYSDRNIAFFPCLYIKLSIIKCKITYIDKYYKYTI